MTEVTVRGGVDTWVRSDKPTQNFSGGRLIQVEENTRIGFLKIQSPAPLNSTIVLAELILTQEGNGVGSHTVQADRVSAGLNFGQVTWNTQPGGTGIGPSVTKTGGGSDGTQWVFDLTAYFQEVADGLPAQGLRLRDSGAGTGGIKFKSSNSGMLSQRPALRVVYTTPPDAPTQLKPGGFGAVSLAKPVVQTDYHDRSGATDLAAIQVQTDIADDFAVADWDSGQVAVTTPTLDLAATSFPGLAEYGKTFWRARVKDGEGVWSGYSDSAEMSRVPKGTLAIVTPAAALATPVLAVPTIAATGGTLPAGTYFYKVTALNAAGETLGSNEQSVTTTGATSTVGLSWAAVPGATGYKVYRSAISGGQSASPALVATLGAVTAYTDTGTAVSAGAVPAVNTTGWVVTEFTATIDWTWTAPAAPPGGWVGVAPTAQTHYQVTVALVSDPFAILYDSGKIQSAVTEHALPAGVLADAQLYRVTVYVWDNTPRESTVGDPSYTSVFRDFTVAYDAQVAAVTGLAATPVPDTPYVDVTWQRGTAPDSWTIGRDDGAGETAVVTDIPAADLLVSGSSYAWRDYSATPEKLSVYRVRPQVAGKLAATGPTDDAQPVAVGIWLTDPTNGESVVLGGDTFSTEQNDLAEQFNVLGSLDVIRVVMGLTGLSGSMEDLLLSTRGGVGWEEYQRRLYAMKAKPASVFRLAFGDLNIPVVVGNLRIAPHPDTLPGQVLKSVSFDWWQTSEHPFSGVF